MRKQSIVLVILLILSFTFGNELELVKSFINSDDIFEAFNDKEEKISIIDLKMTDIGGDGIKEVFVHVKPAYMQSPTILICQITSEENVKRITECLAPGKLINNSGQLSDCHTLGIAIDATASGSHEDLDIEKLLKLEKGCTVLYNTFFHMDTRSGPPIFIDMRHLKDKILNRKTCEGFEFSRILDFDIGSYENCSTSAFFLNSDELYIYQINSISEKGLLEKTVIVKELKFKPRSLLKSSKGEIFIVDEAGKSHNISKL